MLRVSPKTGEMRVIHARHAETGVKALGIENLAKLNLRDFAPFITHVRFPSFKNLESGTRIDFNHPITALVGPNGTNKSSVLRSLQGCPDNQNIGNYWFDTNLDPIRDGSGNRYIHGYQVPSGKIVEVIKKRVDRSDRRPDYFETASPKVRDGMDRMPAPSETLAVDLPFRVQTRWKSIEKPVIYLDFRQEIPAYDIHFHFNWRGAPSSIQDKKKLVRLRANHVAQALENLEDTHELYGKDRILESAISLDVDEVSAVSKILGRDYSDIRIVKHDLFNVEGYTARMRTPHLSYSEAFAGSGEFAAIMMVRGISQAPSGALILMDEPETSLHPGAQHELMHYLYSQTVAKKLQVVITTHSPAIIRDLPKKSLKMLSLNEHSGKVELLSQSATVSEAFHRVGAHFAPKTVFVEDDLAAEIVKRAARLIGADFLKTIVVKIVPGGAGAIKSRLIPTLPHSAPTSLVVLDGDQRPVNPLRKSSVVPEAELAAELKKIEIPAAHFKNGGNDKSATQLHKDQRALLEWVSSRLQYLPGGQPEQLLLELEGINQEDPLAAKEYWRLKAFMDLGLTDGESVTSGQILDSQRRFLASIDESSAQMQSLCSMLKNLLV